MKEFFTAIDKKSVVSRDVADFLVGLARSYPTNENTTRLLHWALDLHPGHAMALNGLGSLAMGKKDYQQAALEYGRAHRSMTLNNEVNPAYLINWAKALRGQLQYDEAIANLHEALEYNAELAEAYIELAGIYAEIDDLELYEGALNEALILDPENPKLILARGSLHMLHGEEEMGWSDYEMRSSRLENLNSLDEYEEWTGQPLEGKSIRVTWEQGFGDVIMFSRYLKGLFAQDPKHVVIESRAQMARLQASLARKVPDLRLIHNSEIVSRVEDGMECDYWVTLGSLARRFPKLKDEVGYLGIYAEDEAKFAKLIPSDGTLRVGLCWKGRKDHLNDRFRSMEFSDLRPLLDVQGCTFYSLQAGFEDSDLPNLINYCHDFADTAAAIWNLDLVITCDTAVAHVAGAIGQPVWMMLGKPFDWRWGLKGDHTPWYPQATLFRTPKPLEWSTVVQEVAAKLTTVASVKDRGVRMVIRPDTGVAVSTKPCKYGEMSFHDNDKYVGRCLNLYGEYSEGEVDLFWKLLNPGDLVVEVGANIGALTVPLIKIVGNGQVLAFEPQPLYYDLLMMNTHTPGMSTECFQMAVGDSDSEIKMRDIETGRIHAPAWESSGMEFTIWKRKLDTLMQEIPNRSNITLLKIDVDGQEMEVLRGAEQTINEDRPIIYIEWDRPERYPDMLQWLTQHDYRVYHHLPQYYNPENFRGYKLNVFEGIVSSMFLCIPQEEKKWRLSTLPKGIRRMKQ